MIKETKVSQEVVEQHKFCDVCGAEIDIGLACGVACCECCRADLCRDCIGHEQNSCGDYRIVWCAKCWEIGEKYQSEIEKLEKRIEDLHDEWNRECDKIV